VPAGDSDGGVAVEAVTADGEVAQAGHDGRPVSGADLGMVLGEGHVADPVQLVLDGPMVLDERGELVGADVAEAEVGDGVDGLGFGEGPQAVLGVGGDRARCPSRRWCSGVGGA
jgi:hypothetical protein